MVPLYKSADFLELRAFTSVYLRPEQALPGAPCKVGDYVFRVPHRDVIKSILKSLLLERLGKGSHPRSKRLDDAKALFSEQELKEIFEAATAAKRRAKPLR